jgi:hypothetical protein
MTLVVESAFLGLAYMSIPSFDDAIMSIVRFVESGRAFGSLKLTHIRA